MQQIKTGSEVISEVKFALPKSSKDQVWKIMNNGQTDFDKILEVSEEFDLDIGETGMIYRLTEKTKPNNSTQENKTDGQER